MSMDIGKEKNVVSFINDFLKGKYNSRDLQTQINAGWCDWYCKDSCLLRKTKMIGSIVSEIKNNNKVDLEKWFVWFKNQVSQEGEYYDEFFFDIAETSKTVLSVKINVVKRRTRYSVFKYLDDYDENNKELIFETHIKGKLIEWFNKKD